MREINTAKAAHAKAEKLKVKVIVSLRDDSRKCTYRRIEYLKCGSVYDIQDQTFSRWVRVGKEYCGYCNGSQKALPPELKARQLNDKLVGSIYEELVEVVTYLGYLTEKDQAYCTLKFLSCGHLKKYSTSVFGHMLREGKAFRCDECVQTTTSEIERVVGSKLPVHYKPQVHYNDIRDCHKKGQRITFLSKTIP